MLFSSFVLQRTPCRGRSLPGAGAPLRVQVHGGHPQADEAGEEGLLHVGVLLEGHVLDDGRQLVVVSDHDPALQAAVAVLRVLPRGGGMNDEGGIGEVERDVNTCCICAGWRGGDGLARSV